MLLFLDVISPLPEFCVIDDNKVILQEKIIQNETDKLSDNIIQTYIEIDKRLNLTKNLKKISTTIGPGSYTSLRVGSAFISGLMISRNIPSSGWKWSRGTGMMGFLNDIASQRCGVST